MDATLSVLVMMNVIKIEHALKNVDYDNIYVELNKILLLLLFI